MEQKASIGRIVHYVLEDKYGEKQHRPAIIVRIWNEGTEQEMVQLQVFTDGTNDGEQFASGLFWATSIHHSDEHEVGTYHWPERV